MGGRVIYLSEGSGEAAVGEDGDRKRKGLIIHLI